MSNPVELRDGSTALDPRLDRVRLFDDASDNYRILSFAGVRTFPKHRAYTWSRPDKLQLDQGQEGACVSCGIGHELAARPGVVSGITMRWCFDNVYHPAQHDDPWRGCALGPRCVIDPRGPKMDGTAVLSGLRVVHKMGLIGGYVWAYTLEEALYWLGYKGPLVIGVNWYRGMSTPDDEGIIHPTGSLDGGHCVEVDRFDVKRGLVGGPNSWGADWGKNGRWYMPVEEFDRLRLEDGEVAATVGRKKTTVA